MKWSYDTEGDKLRQMCTKDLTHAHLIFPYWPQKHVYFNIKIWRWMLHVLPASVLSPLCALSDSQWYMHILSFSSSISKTNIWPEFGQDMDCKIPIQAPKRSQREHGNGQRTKKRRKVKKRGHVSSDSRPQDNHIPTCTPLHLHLHLFYNSIFPTPPSGVGGGQVLLPSASCEKWPTCALPMGNW